MVQYRGLILGAMVVGEQKTAVPATSCRPMGGLTLETCSDRHQADEANPHRQNGGSHEVQITDGHRCLRPVV